MILIKQKIKHYKIGKKILLKNINEIKMRLIPGKKELKQK